MGYAAHLNWGFYGLSGSLLLQHGFRKRVIVLLSRSYRFLALQNNEGHFNSARTEVPIWH